MGEISPPFWDTMEKGVDFHPGGDIHPLCLYGLGQPVTTFSAHIFLSISYIPVASSKSRQACSVAGNVVTPKRACLAPEKVEVCVIV